MKKVFTLLMVLLLGLGLVACKNNEGDEDEAKAPVLNGVEAVEIMVGETFDPKAGVTATDEVDGDLTSAIVITGTVDVNKAGEYELTYTVTNSAEKVTSKRRVVTVKGLGGLVNGDFSDGLNGWTTWYDDSKDYDVEYGVEDGKAVIDIKEVDENDNQWWAIQLAFKQIELEAFESYKLIFTVSAENERYINYQIQGGNIPGGKAFGEKNAFIINDTPQTIEKEFFVKGDAEGAELQFAFGNFTLDMYGEDINEELGKVAGKVFISNVQIVAGPELENQAPELTATDVYLLPGEENFLILQGVTVSDDRDMLTLDDVIYTDVSEGDEFKLPAVAGVYKIEYKVEDSEGLEATVVRTITVAQPWDRPMDMKVEDGGWFLTDIDGEGRILITSEEGITSVEIVEIAPDDWRTGLGIGGINLLPGKYTVTFEAKADDARLLRTAFEHMGLSNGYIDHEITTDWTTITIEYQINELQTGRAFNFWFGSLTTDRPGAPANEASADILTTIHFRNFAVTYTK
jgi:hypothetical protein